MDIVKSCRLVYSSLHMDDIPCRETIVQNGDCKPLMKTFGGVVPCLRRND